MTHLRVWMGSIVPTGRATNVDRVCGERSRNSFEIRAVERRGTAPAVSGTIQSIRLAVHADGGVAMSHTVKSAAAGFTRTTIMMVVALIQAMHRTHFGSVARRGVRKV